MSESLFTTQTPAVDGTDGAPGITTGTTFRSSVDGTITHVRFYTGASPSGTYTGLIWQRTANDTGGGGTGTLLAEKAFSGTPAGHAWNLIELDTPVPITAGLTYRVGVHNPTQYVATNNFFTVTLTNGDLVADFDGATGADALGLIRQGTFVIGSSPAYPVNVGSAASYFVDVVFVPAGSGPAQGEADLGLGLTLAAAGGRDSGGPAALQLALALVSTGSRNSDGHTGAALALALAASGGAAASGSAALQVGLVLASTGAAPASGSATLGLDLVLGAEGSGSDRCLPFPWTCTGTPGFPGACVPVPSFSEVLR